MLGFEIRGRHLIIPLLILAFLGWAAGKGVEWVVERVHITWGDDE